MLNKTIAFALAAFLALGCSAAESPDSDTAATGGGDAPAVIRWTAIPDANQEMLKEKYAPVSAYLTETLGTTFEYVPVTDYKASVEAFKNGDVYLAWFGGLTGVQARLAVPGAQAIAQGAADPHYKSYFIAHASTGIEKSDEFPMELANHPFTFGSESSTSGRLMPEFFLRQATGKGPDEFFTKGFAFSGAHDTTAKQVEAGGQVKAGALSYKKYDKMVASGELDPEKCRIVWVTPDYADYNWTAHPALGEEMIGKIQQALIDLDDKELLGALLRDDLIKAANEDFQNIEDTARKLELVR